MAESYGDHDKDKFVVAFGESDGGHSFVTLSDAIDAESIKSVQPQDDVWGAIDSLRNGSAQIAVIPFSNKITSAEAATVAGLASGDLKILGQIQRRTNHVLVGLKHNINRVDKAASDAGYAEAHPPGQSDGASSSLDRLGPNREPSTEAVRQFVFLMHMVYSSKTVFDQTRGKLTGSDFRSAIRVEHTSNPMRVLLRDHRDRKTQAIIGKLESWSGEWDANGKAKPGYQNIILGQPSQSVEKHIQDNYFSAALVAEGLLDSARHVCGVGPGMTPNKLCSQRLSEMTEHLCELRTDAETPLDLPNNVTTFLVVQAANAKLSDGLKRKFPWATGGARIADEQKSLESQIKSLESRVARFEAAITATSTQLQDEKDPLRTIEIREQKDRLEAEWSMSSKELSNLRGGKVSPDGEGLGPDPRNAALRAAFLLTVDGADADWAKAFKVFETRMNEQFKSYKLKFDQSPELANHLGKGVLLVSARLDGADPAKAAQIENEISRFFKRQKEYDSKAASSLAWLADQAASSQPKKFEPKLLGVYPSWSVSGPKRNHWTAEGGMSTKAKEIAAMKQTMNIMGILMFVLFWVMVIFLVTVTSTPYGRAWVMSLGDGIVQYFKTLFLGPS